MTFGFGDAILTTTVRDERASGWMQYKAHKGQRFVMLFIGLVDKDACEFDVDKALNDLGWHFRDSGSDRNGGDALAAPGEASQSGGSDSERIAQGDHP